jgi:hypothetical protein
VIQFSIDGGVTWVDAHCSERCKAGSQTDTFPMRVLVDGDDNGTSNKAKTMCLSGEKCTMVMIPFEHKWKVNDGSIEIAGCGTVAGIRTSTYPPGDGAVIEVAGNEKSGINNGKLLQTKPF